MLFELNYGYHPWMLYNKEVNFCYKSKLADEVSAKQRELIIIHQKNLYYAHKLQKKAHDKGVKPWSIANSNKVWLNNKYIKTKQNEKLEAKFFGPF